MGDHFEDEIEMMRAVVLHYANLIYAERSRADNLRRQLDCALARLALLEDTAYGRALL
jgi:hypothetical protein